MRHEELVQLYQNGEIDMDKYVELYNKIMLEESERMEKTDPIPANYKRETT